MDWGTFESDGSEGRGNFHGISFSIRLPIVMAGEEFEKSFWHPEFYGIIRSSEIPILCGTGKSGLNECTCGCAVNVESLPDWLPEDRIPEGYSREDSFMVPVEKS